MFHALMAQASAASGTVLDLSRPIELSRAIAPELLLCAGAMIMLLYAAWKPESAAHQRRVATGSMIVALLTLIVVPIIYYLFDRVLAKLGMDKRDKIELVDKTLEELEHETAMLEEKKMSHAH